MRCGARRVVLGETGQLPAVLSELDNTLPVTGLAMLGGGLSGSCTNFRACCATRPVLEKAAGGRGMLTN